MENKDNARIFTEENGHYAFDCSSAVWATDQIHTVYNSLGAPLKDVNLAIEDAEGVILVEYKNANIPEAVNRNAFQPDSEKKIMDVSVKFYDSLHYLRLAGKDESVSYVYVLEYPHGDSVTRRRLRNRIQTRLQEAAGNGRKLIERLEVLSIQEWNAHARYAKFPLGKVEKQ